MQPNVPIIIPNFKFGGVMVLAVQFFNKIKTKNLKNVCFAVFPTCYNKYIYFR